MKRLVLLIALITLPLYLFAETVTVTVTDRDLDIPLEGVTITLRPYEFETVTDENGVALVELPDDADRAMVFAELPGYQSQRVSISGSDRSVAMVLSITDVIEGRELVVERSAPGKKDEQSGISVAMDKSEMDTTANLGLVEDIMSSIKTLPGMSYSGGFNAQPSIRGGYPDEMGAVMDGVYITQPFQWGGGYSIFNPNMVESAKMSHGVFSARYGRALSGLLEVTTVQPDAGEFRFIGGISTTSLDFFAQAPIGKKSGIFLGGKVTYLESMQFLNDVIMDQSPKLKDTIPTMPYIRNFYTKFYHEHSPTLNFGLNAFIGSDGIGVREEEEENGITTDMKFNWDYILGFVAFKVNWMPTDRNTVRFLGAWNINTYELEYEEKVSGSREYSDEFADEYGALPGAGTGFTLDGLDMEGESDTTIHQLQAKIETDVLLAKNHVLTFGAEEIFHSTDIYEAFGGWVPMEFYEPAEIRYNYYTMDTEGNRIIHSAAFALWAFGSEQSTLRGELGVRGEHYYLWNNGYDLKTLPVVNPRASLNWTPIRNRGALEAVTFSAGSGIFSQFPAILSAMEEKYGIDDYDLGPDQSWFQVAGVEARFPESWSFRIEGYYKHYLKRLYAAGYYNELTGDTDISTDDNGEGYTAGFDLMLRKKQGRYFDGYLSYSFIYSRFKNPMTPRGDTTETIDGDPLDEWYYPSFHRFHTLNLVLNWRPSPGVTVTVTSSLATGTPREAVGDVIASPTLFNGQVVERYTRSSFYSDTLRSDISCPVNLRIAYSNYYTNSKIRWEYYFGIEDIFVNLYKPKTNPRFDPYTGEEVKDSDSADFNIGIPVFSVGYKISY
jgi:hypothetical protein